VRFGAAAAVLLLSASRARAEDPFDVRLIPPNVMLVLDTSGSMQYLQVEHRVPTCTGATTPDDPAARTRFMMIQDALLGPISDATFSCERYATRYWSGLGSGGATECVRLTPDEICSTDGRVCRCRKPDGTPIPEPRFRIPPNWVIPNFVAYGVRDVPYGILERYRERVRFGLATFDAFYSGQSDIDGMWSYQNFEEPLPWTDGSTGAVNLINVGIRRAEAASNPVFGGLTSWGGDGTDLNLLNAQVRREVEESICYCGSPVAAAFRDLRHFLLADPANVAPADGGTDCFYNCRERFVVLVTDGVPNTGEGNPYPTSARAAGDLYRLANNAPVYVIGFSLCPDGTTDGVEVRRILDEIACEGCPTGAPECFDTCGALYADDTDELIAALDRVLYYTNRAITSRTQAVVTNEIAADDPPEVVQYQFNTALELSTAPGAPWKGILERSGYICSAGGAVVPSLDTAHYTDYGEVLNDRVTVRELKTVTTPFSGPRRTPYAAPVALEAFADTNPNIDDAQLGQPGRSAADPTFVRRVIDEIHAVPGSIRHTHDARLADIYHASIAVSGRPNLDIPIVSYYKFQEDRFARVQAVYAATNDGILHAFRANNTTDSSKTAEEMWGYIPNYLLPRIPTQLVSGHMANLDSTPMVRDVRIFKGADTTPESDEWKTVLVGGYRQGGRGYYALDVTDPEAPELLWEINHLTDDEETVEVGDYADLFLTYATPLLGTVFISNEDLTGRPLGEVAVTIFPGGYNSDDPVRTTTGLYVVSTKTGRLIRKLMPSFPDAYACNPTISCELRPECCAQMVTSPVGYGAIPGLVTTRAFVGDDRGRLWRADFASDDPGDWSLDLFYPHPNPPSGDPAAPYLVASQVEFPPAIALNRYNQLVLIFGTGDVDNVAQRDRNRVFSVTERIEFDAGASKYVGRAYHNWTLEFADTAGAVNGEKLTGVPIVFNNVAYFSTFVPIADRSLDCCEVGVGRIWGLVYDNDDPDGDGDTSDWAGLDQDGLLETEEADLFREWDNTYIAGLNILQRPSCIDTGIPPAPGLGGGSRESFQIVAQVGGAGGSHVANQQVPTITIDIPTPPILNYADSWGAVFE
jgi:type IV pilus assembly protein PilY1